MARDPRTPAGRRARLYARLYPQFLADLLTVSGCSAAALSSAMAPAYAVWVASILAAGLGGFGSWALAKRVARESA